MAGLLAGALGPAAAQDALYGKQPPLGSAFVRLVNATSGAISIATDYQPTTRLGTGAGERVTPYGIVEHASDRLLAITVSGAGQQRQLTYQAAANNYVSIVVEQDEAGSISVVPNVDPADFNQNRARLAFYNAVPGCVAATLSIEPSGNAVFKAVAAGSTAARTVNPVESLLKASCSNRPAETTVRLSGMQVGSSYSVWLVRSDPDDALFITADTVATYKPKS